METLDIIIIGGGPIGLACGLEAQKAGLKYVILEKGTLVNSLYYYPSNMTFFSTSERLEIGDVPFVSVNAKPTKNEALEYYRRIADSFRLNVHTFEEVTQIQKKMVFLMWKVRNPPIKLKTSFWPPVFLMLLSN
jgi:thioredoxin reductase (NADPH)